MLPMARHVEAPNPDSADGPATAAVSRVALPSRFSEIGAHRRIGHRDADLKAIGRDSENPAGVIRRSALPVGKRTIMVKALGICGAAEDCTPDTGAVFLVQAAGPKLSAQRQGPCASIITGKPIGPPCPYFSTMKPCAAKTAPAASDDRSSRNACACGAVLVAVTAAG